MKPRFFALTGVLIFTLILAATVGAVGVQPLTIIISAKPGETVPFKIEFKSTEAKPEMIQFALAQPSQKLDGALEFKPADPQTFPEAQWVSLSNSSVNVPQGGNAEVSGMVKVPLNAKGFHMVAIMATQPPIENMGALNIAVMYAVRLEITIDAPGLRPAAEISEFEMLKGPTGEPLIQFKAKNSSLINYATTASVILRNSSTKKLIESVELKPNAFWKNNHEPGILPGSTLLYTGAPKEALLPGQYDLQLFFRYATSSQVLLSKTLEVKTNDFIYPAAKLRIVRVDPNEVSLSGQAGTTVMKGIKIENRSAKPVKINLRPMDIDTDYPYSIIKNTTIEFINGQEYTLEAGRTIVAVLSIKTPKDAPAQGNYGLLRITSLAVDGSTNPIEESYIPLEVVVLGKHNLGAEVTNISAARDDDKLLLSAVIKNTGNIKLSPLVTVSLKNSDGKYVDTVQLAVQDDHSSVLPGKLITLTGITKENFKAGIYKAEINITHDNGQVGSSALDIQVK